jgi:hypothetical protein
MIDEKLKTSLLFIISIFTICNKRLSDRLNNLPFPSIQKIHPELNFYYGIKIPNFSSGVVSNISHD